MPLGSGFGNSGPWGVDPFGQTNFARKVFIGNLPLPYREADLDNDQVFQRFFASLFPETNEFRNKLDRFPSIRDAENIPGDSIPFNAVVRNLDSALTVVSASLPFAVPGNLVHVPAQGGDPSISLTILEVDNALSIFRVGTPWPFVSGVRSGRIVRGGAEAGFKFLAENGSDLLTVVPDLFPDIVGGDFVVIGDVRHSITRVDTGLYRVELYPAPYASGDISVRPVAAASVADGETMTVSDGIHPATVFEFEKPTNPGIVLGHIPILVQDGMSASDVAVAIASSVNGVIADLGVSAEAQGGSVRLVNDTPGLGNAVVVEETVADPGFLVVSANALVRSSRLLLLTLLGRDIGVVDNVSKLEDVRRGIILHSPELFRMKGRVKAYQVRGGLEGLSVDVYVFNQIGASKTYKDPLLYVARVDEAPADIVGMDSVTTEKYFDLGDTANGTIVCVPGSRIADGATITVSDGSNPLVTFEFDKNWFIVPGNIRLAVADYHTAEDVAAIIADGVNGVGAGLQIDATAVGGTVYLVNEAASLAGSVPIIHTVSDASFLVSGMLGGMDQLEVPVRFNDRSEAFQVVGARFTFIPGPSPNQITLQAEGDLVAGDVVQFDSAQRIVTAVGAAPVQPAGTIVTFDNAVGSILSPFAHRVTRGPDLSTFGDFLSIAGFDYKLVEYDSSLFAGRFDVAVRDPVIVGQTVAARRIRRRAVTRRFALGYSRLPSIKLHLRPVPESIFFVGFEGVLNFVRSLDEVRPIHVKVEDVQYEIEGVVTVPVPKVFIEPALMSEQLVLVDDYFDLMPAESDSADSSKQVYVEAP